MRRLLLMLALASLGCGFVSESARAAGPQVKAMNGVLVNAEGMTLYTYDKDRDMPGKTGICPVKVYVMTGVRRISPRFWLPRMAVLKGITASSRAMMQAGNGLTRGNPCTYIKET